MFSKSKRISFASWNADLQLLRIHGVLCTVFVNTAYVYSSLFYILQIHIVRLWLYIQNNFFLVNFHYSTFILQYWQKFKIFVSLDIVFVILKTVIYC